MYLPIMLLIKIIFHLSMILVFQSFLKKLIKIKINNNSNFNRQNFQTLISKFYQNSSMYQLFEIHFNFVLVIPHLFINPMEMDHFPICFLLYYHYFINFVSFLP